MTDALAIIAAALDRAKVDPQPLTAYVRAARLCRALSAALIQAAGENTATRAAELSGLAARIDDYIGA